MNLCAEVGGKVLKAFVMQGLRCGHFIPSIVSGCLASRPVAAFVLFCIDVLIHLAFATPPTTLSTCIDLSMHDTSLFASSCCHYFFHGRYLTLLISFSF